MLRAVRVACLVLALAACVAAADPKPSRPLCTTTPTLSMSWDSVASNKPSVVALGDDFGPSTLVASYAGTVYVYTRTITNDTDKKGRPTNKLVYGPWTQIQTLVSDNPFETASFGASISVSGDVLAVGQPEWLYRSSTQYEFTGAVYLYRRAGVGQNYTPEDVVYYTDQVRQVAPNARFGQTVSLVKNGTMLLVGAPGCCPPDFIGTAFTYYYGLAVFNDTRPSWYQTNGPAQTQVLGLGTSVALADTNPGFVLMGAPGYIANVATGPGVYTAPISASGNVDTSKRSVLPTNALTITPAPDPTTSECGYALSDVDEKRRRVIWTCPGFNNARGATYTSDLVGSQWNTNRRITAPTPADGARFGQSVAYQDPVMIVTVRSFYACRSEHLGSFSASGD